MGFKWLKDILTNTKYVKINSLILRFNVHIKFITEQDDITVGWLFFTDS